MNNVLNFVMLTTLVACAVVGIVQSQDKPDTLESNIAIVQSVGWRQ